MQVVFLQFEYDIKTSFCFFEGRVICKATHEVCEVTRQITGEKELLEEVPWLADSIRRRNPYVDPLNLIQLRAFEMIEAGDEDGPTLMRLAIKGVAAGLRTTG